MAKKTAAAKPAPAAPAAKPETKAALPRKGVRARQQALPEPEPAPAPEPDPEPTESAVSELVAQLHDDDRVDVLDTYVLYRQLHPDTTFQAFLEMVLDQEGRFAIELPVIVLHLAPEEYGITADQHAEIYTTYLELLETEPELLFSEFVDRTFGPETAPEPEPEPTPAPATGRKRAPVEPDPVEAEIRTVELVIPKADMDKVTDFLTRGATKRVKEKKADDLLAAFKISIGDDNQALFSVTNWDDGVGIDRYVKNLKNHEILAELLPSKTLLGEHDFEVNGEAVRVLVSTKG